MTDEQLAKEINGFIGLLIDEKFKLHSKMVKLKEFITSDQFDDISKTQQNLLKRQVVAMAEYYACLNLRLDYLLK